MTQKISIQKTKNPKAKPDQTKLGFGQYFTDHMFIMDIALKKAGTTPALFRTGL